MTDLANSGVDWRAVEAVIFDVDGTLYDHARLRRRMFVRLLRRLATSRSGWRDVRVLRTFRRTRERLALAEVDDVGRRQFVEAAAATGSSVDEVRAIVNRWIELEPLAFMGRYAAPGIGGFVRGLRERRVRTGVFSDYPADDKLSVLGVSVEVVRDAAALDVGRLKPHPQGFLRVAELLNVRPDRCLIIGDRDDRDGEAARRGGFSFLRKVEPGRNLGPMQFSRFEQLKREILAATPTLADDSGEVSGGGHGISLAASR